MSGSGKARGPVLFEVKGVAVRGMADLRKLGVPPAGAGLSMVGHAPARGRLVGLTHTVVVVDEHGARPMPHGRQAMRERDVWDQMASRAASAGQPPPFSDVEIAVGRAYRALTERVAAGGMKCSTGALDAPRAGGGDFIDAYIADAQRLRRLHHAIGWGASMAVRRVRPSVRGARVTISDRQAVDLVCLGDKSLSAVLEAFGWAVAAKTRAVLRDAVSDALGRMAAI